MCLTCLFPLGGGEGAPTLRISERDVLPAEVVACGHLWAFSLAWPLVDCAGHNTSRRHVSLSLHPLGCTSWTGFGFSLSKLAEVGRPWVKWTFEKGSRVGLVGLVNILLNNEIV